MGYGYSLECRKCHSSFSVDLGCGMMFPIVYSRIVEEIKQGKFGDEWKEFFLNQPYMLVDGNNRLYLCEQCGKWSVEPSLSLYAPDDINDIPRLLQEGNAQSFDIWAYCQSMWEFKWLKGYHFVKAYSHKCSICGRRMHKVKELHDEQLCCPDCGSQGEMESSPLFWD